MNTPGPMCWCSLPRGRILALLWCPLTTDSKRWSLRNQPIVSGFSKKSKMPENPGKLPEKPGRVDFFDWSFIVPIISQF